MSASLLFRIVPRTNSIFDQDTPTELNQEMKNLVDMEFPFC